MGDPIEVNALVDVMAAERAPDQALWVGSVKSNLGHTEGAAGIVAAGFAPGCGAPDERAALAEAVEAGIIVVQAARAHSGRVDARDRVRAANFVAADNLPAHKARILLALGLTVTSKLSDLQTFFDTH